MRFFVGGGARPGCFAGFLWLLLACSDQAEPGDATTGGPDAGAHTEPGDGDSGDGDNSGDGDDSGDGDVGDGDSAGDGDGDRTGPTSPTDTDAAVSGGPDAAMPFDPAAPLPADEEGCNGIFAQDLLPTFEVTLSDEDWAGLQDEWNNGKAREAADIEHNPYHPVVEFRYGDISIPTAEIRLRGNPEFWEPLPQDKMQFQLKFPTKAGRFVGLKYAVLEAATYNRHMLRDRLALSILRDVGIKAPCANHARLIVNGEYYGLFTNIEKVDKTFLKRNYEYAGGDLWKRAGWEIKTNEDVATDTRLLGLRNAKAPTTLAGYLNVDSAVRLFAAEAVIPNSDGFWAGGLNGYIYDDPATARFELLPWDFDNTFERFDDDPGGEYPVNPDPVTFEKPTTHGRPWYDVLMSDPDLFAAYIDNVADIVEQGYVPEKLHARIDAWTDQIRDAALADTNKPYDNDLYLKKVDELHDYVDTRHAFLQEWLLCWQTGGQNDGNGTCVK